VIFSALTQHGVEILDVEQVVIRGRIILGVLVATTADPEDLQEAAEQAMASIGMQLEVEVGAGAVGASEKYIGRNKDQLRRKKNNIHYRGKQKKAKLRSRKKFSYIKDGN